MFLYSKKIVFHYPLDHTGQQEEGGVSELSPSLSQKSTTRMLPARSQLRAHHGLRV